MTSISTNDECPTCEPGTCAAYPHLRRRMREDPETWRLVHDRVIAASRGQLIEADSPTPEDLALRSYVVMKGCGGCGGGVMGS